MASKKSGKSSTYGGSSASVSSRAQSARAKAEAAKIRAAYASQELKLKIESARRDAEVQFEKTKIDAQLEVLKLQCEADAAAAEAQVFEMAEGVQVIDEVAAQESENKMQRTSNYVHSQNTLKHARSQHSLTVGLSHMELDEGLIPQRSPVEDIVQPPSLGKLKTEFKAANDVYLPLSTKKQWPAPKADGNSQPYLPQHRDGKFQRYTPERMNVHAQPYFTRQASPAISTPVEEPLAQYLARRDLTNSGLYHFDDKPENYRAWYASFTNTISDINLSAAQQLDLMTKWLGTESREYAKRIRSVYVGNPTEALRKAWERLRECYATPEIMEKSFFQRLESFPRLSNRDHVKLRELGDLLSEILGAKEDGYLTGLSYLDTSRGISPITEKLPFGLQEKWMSAGSRFKEENNGQFPPFEYFCRFVCYEAKKRNDPSFMLTGSAANSIKPERPALKKFNDRNLSVNKTDVAAIKINKRTNVDPTKICPVHDKPHSLQDCRAFRNKPLDERKAFLKEKGICFRCCASTSHLAKDCKSTVKCQECDRNYHVTVMHPGRPLQFPKAPSPSTENGGEGETEANPADVNSSCTKVCGEGQWSRSCAKICLIKVYPKDARHKAVNAYVIMDDQSNRSLAKPEFFNLFDVEGKPFPYRLRTCSGLVETSGRRAEGFQVESLDGKVVITLPSLIECSEIPNNRSEIPTPCAVLQQPHLQHIAKHLPELDPKAEILLLLGRDILRAHKVRQQVNGPHNAPFAQRLDLGWVVVGEVCLGNVHKPTVNSYKTNALEGGRYSIFQPCTGYMHVKGMQDNINQAAKATEETLGKTVFNRTDHDNRPAPSIEDTIFLDMMDANVYRNKENSWIAPLPFRESRQRLPNNREQAVSRFTSLQRVLKRKPEMQEQYFAFMGKLFQNGHAEVAPPLKDGEECWYLPTFGVYHPRKPNQIRVVFDSSAEHHGVSLNNVLLTGPDLNNTLIGVLLRFRKEKVAVLADIQHMFYCFEVSEEHRNYLRFLWHQDNDVTKKVIEYRMKVHVFGNSPSPAVAIYGLRRAIKEGAQLHGTDTVEFVERHFYVDDGLISLPTDHEAINLIRRTQASLGESNLRLHKFASNSPTVLKAFPPEDCATIIKDLDLAGETPLTQRSLGLLWEISTDTFTYLVTTETKPFTRRGILSVVNSIFDPLGLLAPVTIQGRALLRELSSQLSDWDAPLPEGKRDKWDTWRESLQDLRQLHVPRTYSNISLVVAEHTELCLFSDASTKAIGVVAYLKTIQQDGQTEVGFVMGKARLAPQSEPTIPRLELCAAVLAVEMADLIQDELDVKLDAINFYSDSKVILGYIYNTTKRFYVYVHNRVERIRQSSKPEQWHYVPSEENPADHASRALPASRLAQTNWFSGPPFLRSPPAGKAQTCKKFNLLEPENDTEIRPEVQTYSTYLNKDILTPGCFQRFSSIRSLLRGVAFLIHIARSCKQTNKNGECKGWHRCKHPRTPEELDQAMHVVLQATQRSAFTKELAALQAQKPIPKSSCLLQLSPIIEDKLIRVGGRLRHSNLGSDERHPIIMPKDSHVSLLLTRHHHQQVKHQGRHITEGAVRAAGLWVLGGRRLINSVLYNCVTCRKLRGKVEEQHMADLPPERLQVCPPFTYVGLDVFGPWSVVARRTRGGQAESKRWAIMFSCMSSRAVHVELIESMDASSCINALRRFFAIRGPVKQLRSDCGTNFIGASRELGMDRSQLDPNIQGYLSERGCVWEFNPPHASHMGGCWERMIGTARRILDSMLLQLNTRLTHEVLSTLMAEVTAIMNARPLVPVSTDPDNPQILSPSMLLTQKAGVPPPLGDFSERDLYTKQWRQVQALANQFWTRWQREYLPCLQRRQKSLRRNLQIGDVVLLRDKQAVRNSWPIARVTATFPGKDGHVRRVEVKTADQDTIKTFLRPIAEVVLLLPEVKA